MAARSGFNAKVQQYCETFSRQHWEAVNEWYKLNSEYKKQLVLKRNENLRDESYQKALADERDATRLVDDKQAQIEAALDREIKLNAQREFKIDKYEEYKTARDKLVKARLLNEDFKEGPQKAYKAYVEAKEALRHDPTDEKKFTAYATARKNLGSLLQLIDGFEKARLKPKAEGKDEKGENLDEQLKRLRAEKSAAETQLKAVSKRVSKLKKSLEYTTLEDLDERKADTAKAECNVAYAFYSSELTTELETGQPDRSQTGKTIPPTLNLRELHAIFLELAVSPPDSLSETQYKRLYDEMETKYKAWEKKWDLEMDDMIQNSFLIIKGIFNNKLYKDLDPIDKCFIIQSCFYNLFCDSTALFKEFESRHARDVIDKQLEAEVENHTLLTIFKAKMGEKLYTAPIEIDEVIVALNSISRKKEGDKKEEEHPHAEDEEKKQSPEEFLRKKLRFSLSPTEFSQVRRESAITELLPKPLLRYISKEQIIGMRNTSFMGTAENIEPKIRALNDYLYSCDYKENKKETNINNIDKLLKSINLNITPIALENFYEDMKRTKTLTLGSPHHRGFHH